MEEASVEVRTHLAAITNWQVGCKDQATVHMECKCHGEIKNRHVFTDSATQSQCVAATPTILSSSDANKADKTLSVV